MPKFNKQQSGGFKVNGLGATTHIHRMMCQQLNPYYPFRSEQRRFTVVAVEASNQALCKMVTSLQYKELEHPINRLSLVGTFQQKGD